MNIMKASLLALSFAAVFLLTGLPAQAHHSFAATYIGEKEINVEGTVVQIALRSPHITTVPLLVATSDLITVVPRAVGLLYARFASLKLVDPPISIPPIEIKQFWHRRVRNDPGVVWLRKLVAQLFLHQDSSADLNSPLFGPEAGNGRNPFRLCDADGEAFRSSVATDK